MLSRWAALHKEPVVQRTCRSQADSRWAASFAVHIDQVLVGRHCWDRRGALLTVTAHGSCLTELAKAYHSEAEMKGSSWGNRGDQWLDHKLHIGLAARLVQNNIGWEGDERTCRMPRTDMLGSIGKELTSLCRVEG